MKVEPPIVAFLGGVSPDGHGRLISDIWAFSDTEIERTHTFIQWLFPLAEPSLSSPGSPTLNADEIAALRGLSAVRESILNSADWYGAFLSRNPHWKVRYDHNHLRITRVIKSLRLLVDDVQPNRFRERVVQMLGEDHAIVGQKALEFWNKA
jgi:hypothetical protein